jgi:cell division protein FtsI (penicillin-binding protein 3)
MARPAARIVALQAAFGFGLVLIVGRAGWLQLVRGREFARQAAEERTKEVELPASRGTIYDRNGTPLVISQPKFRVQLALKEVKDTALLIRRVSADLKIPAVSLRQMFRRGKPLYPYFHGPYTATEVARLRRMAGVRFTPVYSRIYPSGRLAAPIIGAVSGDAGSGLSGLERALDTVLAGKPGLTVDLKDPSGRQFESPARTIRLPVAGHDVILTIDAELQAIAENALVEALKEFKADAGDVVFLDHRTGELLALASLSATGPALTPSVFTSAFEPGSTAKPFTAAALLALRRVDSTETVTGENGAWTYETVPGGARRTIHDTHAQRVPVTLARAIQVSSNIGVAKFASRLKAEEQYEMLRAFGFGAPTGVEFPSEASGVLNRPHRWRRGYSAQSIAMGYELQVTPTQLAAAYGVFANDGVLMAPTLIREIRDLEGAVLYRHQPEVVRRVLSPEIAAKIRTFLEEAASDSGTGGQAKLRYGILGKTGTARQIENGSYASGEYRASFAAIFPAREPQLVAVVTIDRPHAGEYYGGLIAAPLTARMLQQALAARRSVIDRGALDAGPRETAMAAPPPGRRPAAEPSPPVSAAIQLPVPAAAPARQPFVLVPDVAGRPVRSATFAVHQRGLRVRVDGSGLVRRTVPAAGDSLPAGKTVVLYAERPRTP